MGIYSHYLDQQLDFQQVSTERKKQLKRISEIRGGRDVLVFAADLNKAQAPISISYADLLPISDQLANLKGEALDLILETPGGSGEAAEDIVRLLRGKYESIAVIVPGWAKSAGTIMVMAGDEILMEPASALGPIDAQISWQGKVFSADALLEGLEKIKEEVATTGVLNKAYIPILQGLSPGELQSAENALKFARQLVTDWLAQFKFKNWATHSSTGHPVTDDEKKTRAEEVAKQLCDHRHWLTHGRSVKLTDLRQMRLQISDYSEQPDLADAVRKYHTLLQMTFATTTIYKVFETPGSQIIRLLGPTAPPPTPPGVAGDIAIVEAKCGKCGTVSKVQANIGKKHPLQQGCLPFPKDNKLRCPNCGAEADLTDLRRQIEAQAKKSVVA
ncbi:MAG: ATP-dependent Clp protease proteolytic subunit [Deltaproteobacteria bacterium]|nr:ATP-dependent Clp protease proteolytic subunit [Deltaproteobacteria bacterium]MBI3390624.1 ATP-dependent Clp protease proteolytic subunit [Deltaproteobacteria bacterium]